MSVAQRINASLWSYLGFYKAYENKDGNPHLVKDCRWKFPSFIKQKLWKSNYFWQDTLYTPFNRLIGCKLFGHRDVKLISYYIADDTYFCFNCYRIIGNNNFIEVNIK